MTQTSSKKYALGTRAPDFAHVAETIADVSATLRESDAIGRAVVLFGGGNGFCYAFDANPVKEGDTDFLKTVWKYDCNPPERWGTDVAHLYPGPDGPSEVNATPVLRVNFLVSSSTVPPLTAPEMVSVESRMRVPPVALMVPLEDSAAFTVPWPSSVPIA